MKIGGGLNNEGLIFGYDSDGFKFGGEPTTNYVWNQNAIKQESYDAYVATTAGNWTANHPKAIQVVNSDGTSITGYVNSGVGSWENTHHAHWQYDDELGKPVTVMNCYDGNWKAKSWGAGMGAWSSLGMSAGSKYTISWLQWTNNLTKAAYTGFYSKDGNGSWNFHDGLQAPTNTKTYTWERVSATYTVSSNRNLNDGSGNVYMYGHSVGNNSAPTILKIADVQLELKDHPTKFSPTLTRSITESLLDISNGRNLDTSNIGFTSNEIPTFNGTSHNIDLGTVGGYSSNVTCEAVIKATGSASWKNIMSGGCGDIIFTVNGTKLNFGCQCNSPILHDNFSTTIINDNNYHHVVGTYDGSNIRIYVDGVLESTNPETGNFTPSNLRVGSNYVGSSEYYQGELPMVRLYNRTLSTNEVVQNFLSVKSRFDIA